MKKNKELKKQLANIKVATINNYPDIVLLGGYSYRTNYDDYFNIGIGVNLPIYGSENLYEEKQRALSLVLENQKENIVLVIDGKFDKYYAKMQSSYEIDNILKTKAIAQVDHMLDIVNSSISTGGDTFRQIKILTKKLNLEQKTIKNTQVYFNAYAKILQLQGKLQ